MPDTCKPTAGIYPSVLLGRQSILDKLQESIESGPGARRLLQLLAGDRGAGKPVMVSEFGQVSLGNVWVVIYEMAAPHALDRVARQAKTDREEPGSLDLTDGSTNWKLKTPVVEVNHRDGGHSSWLFGRPTMLLSEPPGRLWRMKQRRIEITGSYTLSAAIYATFVFIVGVPLISALDQPLSLRSVVLTVIMAMTLGAAVVTMIAGVAVTAVHPPLRPISEISVLGRRAVAFARFGLATGGVFSAAFLAWVVATSYDDYYFNDSLTTPEPTLELLGVLGTVLVAACVVYCIWLSVDLLRLRQDRRLRCVDVVVDKIPQRNTMVVKAIRIVAKKALHSSAWILVAFYITPLVFLMFVTAATA